MSKIQTSQILNILEVDVVKSGLKRNTPEFKRALTERKVEKCQEMRGISSCGACSHNPFCALLADFVLDSRNE